MKNFHILALVIVAVFNGTVYSGDYSGRTKKKKVQMDKVNINVLLAKLKSDNAKERMEGFYGLADASNYMAFGSEDKCEFKVSDTSAAKKAVIELLRKEETLDSRNGEYLEDLHSFVDSCEDESAIDLLPGDRTRNKYSQQTIEYILSKFERRGADVYGLRYLKELAPRYKQINRPLYKRVKAKLIDLVDDEKVSDRAVGALASFDDVDLIPVFEKISKYDDTKGTVRIENGEREIIPIAGIAKEALEKLKHKSMQGSKIEYNKN